MRIAHAPGMPGSFSSPPTSKETCKLAIPACITARGVTHVPWCMSGSLTRGGGKNVPGIPGACTTRKFNYPARGPWSIWSNSTCPKKLCDVTFGVNTLRPRQNRRHLAEDIYKCFFLNQSHRILIKIFRKFAPMGLIDNKLALAQMMDSDSD